MRHSNTKEMVRVRLQFMCIYLLLPFRYFLFITLDYLEHSEPSIFDAILLWQCFPLLLSLNARRQFSPSEIMYRIRLYDDKFLPDDLARWIRNCVMIAVILLLHTNKQLAPLARKFSSHRKLILSTNHSQQRANIHTQNKCFETMKPLPQQYVSVIIWFFALNKKRE